MAWIIIIIINIIVEITSKVINAVVKKGIIRVVYINGIQTINFKKQNIIHLRYLQIINVNKKVM